MLYRSWGLTFWASLNWGCHCSQISSKRTVGRVPLLNKYGFRTTRVTTKYESKDHILNLASAQAACITYPRRRFPFRHGWPRLQRTLQRLLALYNLSQPRRVIDMPAEGNRGNSSRNYPYRRKLFNDMVRPRCTEKHSFITTFQTTTAFLFAVTKLLRTNMEVLEKEQEMVKFHIVVIPII